MTIVPPSLTNLPSVPKAVKALGPSTFKKAAPYAAGIAALAALGLANWLVARRTERHNPPHGSFVEVEGVRLHYVVEGEGSPVLLIHGNAVAGDDWEHSGVSALLRTTHKLYRFDRPGCGHSSRPQGKVFTPLQQAELLHKAMQKLGVERPVIVGHSFGATVAVAYATAFQSDVTSLVLVSGYYFWTFRPDAFLAAIGAAPLVGALLRYTCLPFINWLEMPLLKRAIFSPRQVPEEFNDNYSVAMVVRPSQLEATSADGFLMIPSVFVLQDKYKKLTLPVDIITGDSDKIVWKSSSQRLNAAIPHSRLHYVRGAGHMAHYADPDLVAQSVENGIAATIAAVA